MSASAARRFGRDPGIRVVAVGLDWHTHNVISTSRSRRHGVGVDRSGLRDEAWRFLSDRDPTRETVMIITPLRITPTGSTRRPHRRRTAAIVVGLATLAAVVALTVWLVTTAGSSRTVPVSPTVGAQTTTQLPAAPPAEGGHLAP
jgi:hypothetical protein